MTDTTRVWILAAGTIVTASCLDRLPTRERSQQLTHQRRLANVRSKPAHTDNNHVLCSLFFGLCTKYKALSSKHKRYLRLRCGATFGALTLSTPRMSLYKL